MKSGKGDSPSRIRCVAVGRRTALDYHQRPDMPLQSAWRLSRMAPGAQREFETRASSLVESEAGMAVGGVVDAQPTATIASRLANASVRRTRVVPFPFARPLAWGCPIAMLESIRRVLSPIPTVAVDPWSLGNPSLPRSASHSQEGCHARGRALRTPGAIRWGFSARAGGGVGSEFPHHGIRAFLYAVAVGVVAATSIVAPQVGAAHPLHANGHSIRPEGTIARPAPPRVSAESDSALGRWLGGERLTGEWFGARSWLRDRGIELEASYTSDLSRPLRGGVRERDAYRHWADLNGTFDLENLVGLPGATIFFDAYSIWGDFGSADVGDFQYYSNIDNPKGRLQLAELGWGQRLVDERVRLECGKFDSNSEFVFIDAAGDFINSSAGFNQTIFAMVTYPDPATGALAFVDPEGPLYAGVGMFDGSAVTGAKPGKRGPKTWFRDASDHFVIGEVGANWDEKARFGPGRVAAGPWYHSAAFERFDGSSAGGTGGFFLLAEQRVFSLEPEREEGTRDVRAFAEYGWAESDISPTNHHVGAGVLVTGPLALRATDTTGMMVTWVELADVEAAGTPRNETAIELFYRIQLTPFFSIKPDLQVIDNPGGQREDTVWVGTMRFEVGL